MRSVSNLSMELTGRTGRDDWLRRWRTRNGPLTKQLAIGVEQAESRVVDVGRLGCRTVELDDREILPRLEGVDIAVADIESADEESGVRLRNLVDSRSSAGVRR